MALKFSLFHTCLLYFLRAKIIFNVADIIIFAALKSL